MIKLYSKGCEYALRVLTRIPLKDSNRKFLASELSKKAKLSEHSTRKALQSLVAAGLLEAVSGPGGGYKLPKRPERISLLDIIKAVDGENAFNNCVMGLPECDLRKSCPVHSTWSKVKGKLQSEMKNTSLADLMMSVAEK